ncbi:MAG TPA: hypothetical protein VNJ49_14555, partial [Bradyrhizobium sp.]|nr:hypothetical protein [Bradyrhizobium sp.]
MLKAEFGVPARNDRADALGHDFSGFGLDPAVLVELREQLLRKVDAARAGRIGDRLSIEERLSQSLDGADIGFGCAGFHRHADQRAGEI